MFPWVLRHLFFLKIPPLLPFPRELPHSGRFHKGLKALLGRRISPIIHFIKRESRTETLNLDPCLCALGLFCLPYISHGYITCQYAQNDNNYHYLYKSKAPFVVFISH